MIDMLSSRALRFALVALCAAAVPLAGCPGEEDDKDTPDQGTVVADMGNTDQGGQADAGTDPADAGTDPADAGTDPADAGTDPADAGADQGGPQLCSDNSGALACQINEDCPSAERCEPNAGAENASLTGCCRMGARGTKTAGEECTQGDECASSLCIDSTQSPSDDDTAVDYCSKDCVNDQNMADDSLCVPELPKCNLALGICIPAE